MAKGKHSTALFEVIHSANRPDRVAQSLRTPKWWFKGRPAGSDTITETHDAPSFSDPEAAPEPDPAPPRESRSSSRSNHRPRSSAVHFEFDRQRQEITFRLRYTTALVGAFSVCVLLALAYVAGRHISHGPQSASAAEGPQIPRLREQAPQQGVADISHRQRPAPPHEANFPTDPPRRVIEQPAAPKTHEPATLIPAGVESRLPRTVGLNYIVIQTYPSDRRDAADQARDYFTKSGIPCTLVFIDSGRKEWVCLVGTAGFTRISSAEYRKYTEDIIFIGQNSKSAKFDSLKPYGYKWKGTELPAN